MTSNKISKIKASVLKTLESLSIGRVSVRTFTDNTGYLLMVVDPEEDETLLEQEIIINFTNDKQLQLPFTKRESDNEPEPC